MDRVILHVDQNCYFASVEMIAHPELRNVPMAVVGDQEKRHGIILAKNDPAKRFGITTAEPIWKAKEKCPELVCVRANYDKYVFYSRKLQELYYEYTDRIEPFGLDECWLDVTGSNIGDGRFIADQIRRRVREQFQLTCSVGVSYNKIFAKLGSDYKKPDATTVFGRDSLETVIWSLPVSDLLFVGHNTDDKLSKINVRTIGDLARMNKDYIERYLGVSGIRLWKYANGLDDSPVEQTLNGKCVRDESDIKSIGNSTTPASDMTNIDQVGAVFRRLADTVGSRLREKKLMGSVIQISVRDRDLDIYEKQKILWEPSAEGKVLYEAAMELFKMSYEWTKPVRSVGIRCTDLISEDDCYQQSLFSLDSNKKVADRRLSDTIDSINLRYGKGTIGACNGFTGDGEDS